jgi:hypothetical membrane protein
MQSTHAFRPDHVPLIRSHDLTRSTLMADQRVAAIFFLIVASAFMTVIMLAASIAPGYDFGGGAISDLGVIPQTAMLFNITLIAVGALTVAGGYVFYREHRRRWLLGLFVVAGIGSMGAGVFPLDQGAPHSLSALIAFLFFNLQPLGVAAVVRGPMRWLSVLAGATGLAFVVLMVIGDGGNPSAFGAIGHGGTERMIVYPVMLWMLALSGYLLGRDAREP